MKSLTPKRIEKWIAQHKADLSAADLKIARVALLTLPLTKQSAFRESKALRDAARKNMQAFADLAVKMAKR